MSIDRIANVTQTQVMLNQIALANAAFTKAQDQVSSGNLASNYAGYGDSTAAMETARSAQNQATAYQDAAQTALGQANLQDTQLNQLSTLANQLRTTLTTAAANNDGSTLMASVQSIFNQAVQILNSTDQNGNYLFGGDKNTTPPVTATSLTALAAAPSAASVFANGTLGTSVNIGQGQSVGVGVLASNAGAQLLQTIQDVVNFNNGSNGPFSGALSGTQSTFLSGEISNAATAAATVNNVMAQNGDNIQTLTSAVTNQGTLSNFYKTATGNIQNIDLATAMTNLSQAQTQLQATLQVTSQINKISLLNYLNAAPVG